GRRPAHRDPAVPAQAVPVAQAGQLTARFGMDDSGEPQIPQIPQAWLGEHTDVGGADPVREYLKQVSKVPGLTAEQEAELARRIEAGLAAEQRLADEGDRLTASERVDLEWVAEVGTRARNHLLEANLGLGGRRAGAFPAP